MMRTFTFALLIAATINVAGLQAAVSLRPNVVFIMVDDLGWSDVGFNGSKVYETPNVDRLARQGMVLSDFYSGGPVCSPTRASIMTGKYTARTGITTYLLSPTRDAKHVQSHLPLKEFTIAEAFKKNGFATGYFGKWHLGYENDFWAGNQGFDVAKGGIDLPWAWTLCYPDIEEAPTAKMWPKTHTRFFSPYHLTHLENGPDDEYLTERLTNETIGFIEEHREEPFFAFLSFHTVHTPLQAKPEKTEKYSKKIAALGLDSNQEVNRREKAFQNDAAYAAMVEHMDENVGRLLDRLDELKLSEEKPEIVERLLRKLRSWQKSVDAKFKDDVVGRRTTKTASADERPNVLFISVDDWNDWIGCLGHQQAQTPSPCSSITCVNGASRS